MKKHLLILSIFLLSIQNTYSQRGWFKIPETTKTEWRNPGGSFVGSLIIPGYGYFANDMMKEGFTTLAIEGALSGAGIFLFNNPKAETVSYPTYYGTSLYTYTQYTERQSYIVFFGIAAGFHLLQAVHSTILSHKMNKVNGFAFKKPRKSSFEIQTVGIGMSMKLSF
jgi:hypothetical protein